ncbi:DUF4261 domain-containing protein [Massilia sp. CF038]|uniref:DUF4261 domain-containing protein n=1 Tax=Massilia sp. CF038 TaxID=1881045 RepID=UPI0015B61EE7|nr:DUF4261 domain-containing protein [Massilia sp. CF038]
MPKNLFADFATEVIPHGAPLPIWVDYRVGWNDGKTHSAGFTTGLAALGLMEMEAQLAAESPAELRKRFEAITHYLLENGMVIRDGDTVGESASEKIRVQYCPSHFGAKDPVMQLVYAANGDKKPWWKLW